MAAFAALVMGRTVSWRKAFGPHRSDSRKSLTGRCQSAAAASCLLLGGAGVGLRLGQPGGEPCPADTLTFGVNIQGIDRARHNDGNCPFPFEASRAMHTGRLRI